MARWVQSAVVYFEIQRLISHLHTSIFTSSTSNGILPTDKNKRSESFFSNLLEAVWISFKKSIEDNFYHRELQYGF